MPKPRPTGRHPRALSPALRDQIIAYAVEHPTEGPRTIQARLRLARFGSWLVSHGSVYNVLKAAAPHSDTGSTNPPTTSTPTCKPGCGSATTNDLTAANAPADDHPPRSTTPTDPTSSNNKDGTPMTSSNPPEPSARNMGHTD